MTWWNNLRRWVMGPRSSKAESRRLTTEVDLEIRDTIEQARQRAQALDRRALVELDVQRRAATQMLLLLNPDVLDRAKKDASES